MPLNAFDRLISLFSPTAGLRRAQARSVLAYYEAAQPSRLRKNRRERGSGNAAVLRAGSSLREIARHLEQNYDLARGVLNTLVVNTVGANGIGVEPQPRNADGTINQELADQISELWKDWCKHPEVTKQHDYASMCRLLARSWFRDGEVFSQTVAGFISTLDHGTRVPLSVEMLESDFVPMDKHSMAPVINQGIELNAWGAPVAYHVYLSSPLDGVTVSTAGTTKRVPAANMLHVKHVDRIRQLRGVSVFAAVLNRFDDLKDYEESERIAAKIAASMAAFIKKGDPTMYPMPDPNSPAGAEQRHLKFQPGMVFDDLKPGEEIGTIDTNRPNPNLETYRDAQLKAIAAGTGPSFSSVARTYNGTYSAQRQELVESYGTYATLASEFISHIVQPLYERFIATAIASGVLRVPANLKPGTVDDAAFMAPAMPWIDPKKEAEAWAMLEDRAYISGPEIIRKRGGNPRDVLQQQALWLQAKRDANVPPAGQAPQEPVDPRTEEDARALAKAAINRAKAEAALAEVRTRQQEQMGEAILALREAELQAVRARIRLDNAMADEAQAKRDAADAERALTEARSDRERIEAELELERAAKADDLLAEEHQARMAALEQQAAASRRAEQEREQAAQQAQARADELHKIALAAERNRKKITDVDLAAAEQALAELRGGE